MYKHIKRDDVLGTLNAFKLRVLGWEDENPHDKHLVLGALNELGAQLCVIPTADVIKVVRCKDCKYRVPLDKHCNLSSCYGHCTEWHGEETKNVWHKYKKYYKDYSIVEPDGYCSFGERKDEV